MCRNDELDNELSWFFPNIFSATRYMKVKRMGITEILSRIWLFSVNKTKSSESFSKQPSQLIVDLNSSLRHIIVTLAVKMDTVGKNTLSDYLDQSYICNACHCQSEQSKLNAVNQDQPTPLNLSRTFMHKVLLVHF